MTKSERDKDYIEPRVTALEIGQAELQKDLIQLSGLVKEQGANLAKSINNLANKQEELYGALSKSIVDMRQTNWQTIAAYISLVALLVASVLSPLWMYEMDTRNILNKEIEKRELLQNEFYQHLINSSYDRGRFDINHQRDINAQALSRIRQGEAAN